jgi:hypothetical protein
MLDAQFLILEGKKAEAQIKKYWDLQKEATADF